MKLAAVVGSILVAVSSAQSAYLTACTTDADCEASTLKTSYSNFGSNLADEVICSTNALFPFCTLDCSTVTTACTQLQSALSTLAQIDLPLTCSASQECGLDATELSCSTDDDCTGFAAIGLTSCTASVCAPATISSPTVTSAASCADACPTTGNHYACIKPADIAAELDALLPECVEGANECLVRCQIYDKILADTGLAPDQANALAVQQTGSSVDDFLDDICTAGVACPDPNPSSTSSGTTATSSTSSGTSSTASSSATEEPTTTEEPETTEEPTCDNSDYWYVDNCVEDEGEGCSLLLDATVNVCSITRRFNRGQVYKWIKKAYAAWMDSELGEKFESLCSADDMRIEGFSVEFLDTAARQRETGAPPTVDDDCDAFEDICDAGLAKSNLEISVSVGFFCFTELSTTAQCQQTESVFAILPGLADAASQFVDIVDGEIKRLAIDDDGVCTRAPGVGAVNADITSAALTLRDEHGDDLTTVVFKQPSAAYSGYCSGVVAMAMLLFVAFMQ